METENDKLFIAYLEETMSTSEHGKFEDKLKNDTAFRESFLAFNEIYEVLQNQFSHQRKEVIKSIKKADAKYKVVGATKTSTKKVIPLRAWHYAVAASIILAVGLFLFQDANKPSYADFTTNNAISLTVRGNNDSVAQNAEKAFNNGNYAEAVTGFNTLLKSAPGNVQFQIYKAKALIEIDKYDQAEHLLKTISEGDSVYKSKAIWLEALSKLKQKRYDEVKRLLKTIDSNSSEYPQAQKLLKRL